MDKSPYDAKQLKLPKPKRQWRGHTPLNAMSEAERNHVQTVMSATPEEVVASKEALKNALQSKFIKHHIGMPSESELIEGNNYVVGQDGLYLVRKNKIGTFVTKANKIPFIDDNKQPVEGFHMILERKVPYDYLLQTISFFKKVLKDKGNAEAMVQIAWKPENNENEKPGRYIIHVADQEVSGGSVRFKRDEEWERSVILLLDIHSHNTMGAFFSGTDNADEKEARAYGVIGKLNQDWPAMKWRAGDGNGGWIELGMWDVFETPDANTEFPDEWMEKVHKPGSGIFTEHNRPPQRQGYYPGYRQPMPSRPWNPNYERKTYVPERGWNRGATNVRPSFGKVGDVDQDMLGFDWDRWEQEVGPIDEEYMLPGEIDRTSIGSGINALVESMEVLPADDAYAIAISLVEKLDTNAKDVLFKALQESK